MLSAAALADEKIKLAQAIGQGGASTSATATSGSISGSTTAAATTANYIAVGD